MLMPLAGCMVGANPVHNWPLSYRAALHNIIILKPSFILLQHALKFILTISFQFFVPVVEHEMFITGSSYKSCKISGIFKAQAHPKM